MGNYCGSDAWRRAFQAEHGRPPTASDLRDCQWGEQYASQQGRPPTQEEWERRWYQEQGLPIPPELAGIGEGEGGGLGGEEMAAEIWPLLELPTVSAAPPLLRDVWRYITELITQNPAMTIPPPFHYEEEAEELEEAGVAQRAKLEELATMLGLRGGEEEAGAIQRAGLAGLNWPVETPTQLEAAQPEMPLEKYEWEQLFRSMALASPQAQQALAGLRYAPESGWFFEQVALLPHLQHL